MRFGGMAQWKSLNVTSLLFWTVCFNELNYVYIIINELGLVGN